MKREFENRKSVILGDYDVVTANNKMENESLIEFDNSPILSIRRFENCFYCDSESSIKLLLYKKTTNNDSALKREAFYVYMCSQCLDMFAKMVSAIKNTLPNNYNEKNNKTETILLDI